MIPTYSVPTSYLRTTAILAISLLLTYISVNYFDEQVVINEFMAANNVTINDPDFKKNADWIELYNGSLTAVDLSGYSLSDDLDDPEKWQIPNGTVIEGRGYLLFWADKENTGKHTNFKLAKDGEEIGLFNAKSQLLDAVKYQKQSTDISYGRTTDGGDTFALFPKPTPATKNSGASFNGLVYDKPTFSIEGGVYNAPIEVSLSANHGTIRYSMDGTEPVETSSVYSRPIVIDHTSVLRARVFAKDKIPGKTVTHSYFLNENFKERNLPVVSIVTDPAYFWDPDIGIYMQDFKPLWESPINIEFFENEGNSHAVFNEAAGMKMNGNNSWQFPQKILGIYFRNRYGNKTVNHPIFAGRNRSSFDYFALRASGNDQGATFFRDGLIQKLVEENMDFELQGFRPASVYVNGKYLGLYNMRSKQNKEYLEYYFNLKPGQYDLIKNNGEVNAGDISAFRQLFYLLNQDLSITDNYNAVADVMDIDNLIDYFIAEIWSSNRSWGHNIKIWKAKAPGAKWRWIFKDIDRGMSGSYDNGIAYFTDPDVARSSDEYAIVVLRQLFHNTKFANLFVARFADHLYTTFHPNRIRTYIEEMKTTIEKEIPYHLQVWGGATASYGDALPSQEHWRNEVLELNTYATDRLTYLYKDITEHFYVSPTAKLGIVCQPTGAGHIRLNALKIPADNWSGRYFMDITAKLKAEAMTGYEFKGWSLATYQSIIPKSSNWKYLDNGSLPKPGWQTTAFNDADWASGPAQLGYGDGDEQTITLFGNKPDNKAITTYFRKTFTIDDVSKYTGQLVIDLLKDDGAVIYLNGTEISRINMPDGIIESTTTAYHTVSDEQENDYTQLVVNTDKLLQGNNVLAVEVHQRRPSSSDLSFDLKLSAVKLNESEIFSSNSELEISLTNDTVFVAKFKPTDASLLPIKDNGATREH